MEKKHLILVAAGIVLAVWIYNAGRKKIPDPANIIKPGDKGNEIYGLQSAITSITGLKFPDMGVYDSETLTAVRYYLKDTSALVNYERGYVNKSFARDLYLLQGKISGS